MSSSVELVAERVCRAPTALDDASTTETLAHLSGRVAQALLASEHLEDIFADRSVVEREVLDATRAALREACAARDEALVHVELDLLGYVAATAGRRAAQETIISALERAGRTARATLEAYNAQTREALFFPEPRSHPDLRLELEEIVADELCALVQRGDVELPTIDRTVSLVHDVAASERARLSRYIDRAATRTLRRTGCQAKWELPSGSRLHVRFTPLSEQDARDVDAYVGAFAREVDSLFEEAGAPLVAKSETTETQAPPSPPLTAPITIEIEVEVEPEQEPRAVHGNGEAPIEAEDEAAPTRTTRARQERKATTKRVSRTPSRPSTTRAATTKRATPQKRPTTKRAKKTTTEEATATKRSRTPTTKARAAKKR